MHHRIEFGESPDGVIVYTFGRADVEGFRALNEALVGDRRFRPGMQILVDHTQLDAGHLTVAEIEEIGRHLLTLAERIGDSPIALIASDALTKLATGASAAHAAAASFNPEIFESLSDGIRWLMQQERREEQR